MADLLEWYAADDYYGNEASAVTPVIWGPYPDVAIYAHAPGLPSPIVWTLIWEPLSGGSAPDIFFGGPLTAGQFPTVRGGGGSPAVYVPGDPDAVGVINFWNQGIVRLLATANGAPVPGELRMAIVGEGGSYPDLTLSYAAGAEADAFWTQHQATYEIP